MGWPRLSDNSVTLPTAPDRRRIADGIAERRKCGRTGRRRAGVRICTLAGSERLSRRGATGRHQRPRRADNDERLSDRRRQAPSSARELDAAGGRRQDSRVECPRVCRVLRRMAERLPAPGVLRPGAPTTCLVGRTAGALQIAECGRCVLSPGGRGWRWRVANLPADALRCKWKYALFSSSTAIVSNSKPVNLICFRRAGFKSPPGLIRSTNRCRRHVSGEGVGATRGAAFVLCGFSGKQRRASIRDAHRSRRHPRANGSEERCLPLTHAARCFESG